MSKNWRGVELDDGLLVAAARFAGANVHSLNSIVQAYKSCTYPICRTQEQADILALRIRRILNGMNQDEAERLWRIEFDKTKKENV